MADQNVRGQVARGGGPMGGAMATARAEDARGAARRLIAYLKPYRGKLVLVTVLLVVGAGLSLVSPLLIGQAIDTIIKTHSAQAPHRAGNRHDYQDAQRSGSAAHRRPDDCSRDRHMACRVVAGMDHGRRLAVCRA